MKNLLNPLFGSVPAIGLLSLTLALSSTPGLAGIFSDDADVASRNLSKAADNFEILRRVVFMNGIIDRYMLEIIGLCSIVDQQK